MITGLGLVTPLGNSVEESWNNILAGNSGISTITHFDASAFPVRISGSIRNFDLDSYIPRKEQKKMGVFIHYGMAAGIQAVEDAGIDVNDVDPYRVGVTIGSGIGGISGIEKRDREYSEQRSQKDFAVLRAEQYHQYDFREPVDSLWFQGA